MKVSIEITDSFNHEANYSWVRRYTLTTPDATSDYSVVRRVKAHVGWAGKRCITVRYGDMIELRPHGECVVCFITFEPEEVAA